MRGLGEWPWMPTYHLASDYMKRPIFKAIGKQYQKAVERGWDKMYWAIDLHETLTPPTYVMEDAKQGIAMYPGAADMLNDIMSLEKNRIILWSSQTNQQMIDHKRALFPIEQWSRVHLNRNPEEGSTDYAYFGDKFYFNVLLDDKAGFDPEIDIYAVRYAIAYYEHCLATNLRWYE